MTKEDDKSSKDKHKLTKEDLQILQHLYDFSGDGNLSKAEIRLIVDDYNTYLKNKCVPYSSKLSMVKKILEKYDVNGDGILDESETEEIHSHLNDFQGARYAGYSSAFARAARYKHYCVLFI